MDIYIGKIVNTHGIKGEIRIISDILGASFAKPPYFTRLCSPDIAEIRYAKLKNSIDLIY